MGSVPSRPVKQRVSIGTMLNFHGDGHGDASTVCNRIYRPLPEGSQTAGGVQRDEIIVHHDGIIIR